MSDRAEYESIELQNLAKIEEANLEEISLNDTSKLEILSESLEECKNDGEKSFLKQIHFSDGVLEVEDENICDSCSTEMTQTEPENFYKRKLSQAGRISLSVVDSVGENLALLFGLVPPLVKEEEKKKKEEIRRTTSLKFSDSSTSHEYKDDFKSDENKLLR